MDPVTKNLRALQGALEHSLTIQRARVQEIVDDLVSRGTLSRTDADGLIGQLLSSSKDYSQALLQVLESVTSETRKTLGAGIAPVMATAGKLAGTVRKAPGLGGKKAVKLAPKQAAQAPKAAPAPPVDPLPGLAAMTVAEIKPRLAGLSVGALRKVRDNELAGKARKSVIGQIDTLLGAKS
ncbi:hypothetical protein F0U44_20385 [Nocardioides humilatus]|uniref:Uncharacterized protein n=1 Tax=Nocardioides humilatus TaxID=2607660 RepID=A0A5B1L8H2_9ACTN|nr:hypothetical protein [Nocardioides humilatus]KAA1415987.1 hypothetical protein F0U44_20385 [Nocardioides humilatus]